MMLRNALLLANHAQLLHDPPVLSARIANTVCTDEPAPGEEQPEE